MDGITIALSKGRIFEETLPLLAAAGIEPLENPETSRKLIIPTNRDDVRVVIVRATDAPTYVQYGAADIGVAGKDVLIEHGGDGLYQPLDLQIAKCRMMVAIPAGFDYENAVRQGAQQLGLSHMDIVSGAGHDAIFVAELGPAGMIFVPCEGGISHNEIENAAPDDLAAGCAVLLRAMVNAAQGDVA